MAGRLEAIWIKRGHRAPMKELTEALLPSLRAAMRPNWGGGVFAQVLDDGVITIGDAVGFEA